MKVVRTSTISESLNILLKGQLKFLSNHFEIVGISSNIDSLNELSEREGVKTVEVNMERGISLYDDIFSLIQLIKVLKKEKPTIVHSITPKAGLLTMLAGKIVGVPIRMHTFTGLIFPSKKGFFQKLLIIMDKLLCWASTNVYPEGNGVKNDLLNYHITSKPLKILANGNVNGIDLDFFSNENISLEEKALLKHSLGIKESDFVFIFVGRLVGDKGINELIHAFKNLCKANDNIKLLLVGSMESELDPLKDITLKEINENKNIIFVGFQKDVRSYFAISDALVFPSYREGFPNVVMQAGAMALPSIVSNINGCNEIIIEGENGIIIPVKNTEAILNAMQMLASDTYFYNKLQQKARPMIQSRYEQSVVWNALLEEYNHLIIQLKN